MSSPLFFILIFTIGNLALFTWGHIFFSLLWLDFIGASIIFTAVGASSPCFILLLTLQVYSSVLGVSILFPTIRKLGSDNVGVFF